MSKTKISTANKLVLWARTAGRCEFRGCNENLIGDLLTGNDRGRFGLIAHIVADEPNGPRGHPNRSPLLANDISNLMLVCGKHHRLIDVEEPENYSEDALLEMKALHERRIADVTAIDANRASHVVCYAASIGGHEAVVDFDAVRQAMLPERYPFDGRAIRIELLDGATVRDSDPDYWTIQRKHLKTRFDKTVGERLAAREIGHVSVFALAPQPLLVELGTHLCDILDVEVHQLHREPKGWRWAESGRRIDFRVRKPSTFDGPPALILALSATVVDDRISAAVGSGHRVWSITAASPGNDVLRHRGDLTTFRDLVRSTFDEIKAAHPRADEIAIFPALPVAAAVEVGRVWMPKADLPLAIYDEQRPRGFVPALRIGRSGSSPDFARAIEGLHADRGQQGCRTKSRASRRSAGHS